ncbi:MAG: single-stranded-DNA-specific exonuclease RecJ [Acidobacteriota bacterium]|nr:single-stranded-DNA-specific exonuclease RecJ [Acidobacteriota bacterium]
MSSRSGASPSPAAPANACRWDAAEVPEAARDLVQAGIPPRLAPLLARRGLEDPDSARRFLTPTPDHLHDPFLLAGMDAAVERLLAMREEGAKVAIVGDYDVDGVTAAALLSAVFEACGLGVETILPRRMSEGYGFQPVHVERAAAAGCRLIVTADCGTTSQAAVSAAGEAGLEVVVTDHHLPDQPLPEGTVQINPKQSHCDYPFPELSGAGLALKLALALAQRVERPLPLPALLRIACLGTIADLVPLVGENRVIAALGLRALSETRSVGPGLQALMRQSGLKLPITAVDVGFRLGPRINAAGRLDTADTALELLLCRDRQRAAALARQLDDWNRRRQDEEMKVVEEARQMVLDLPSLPPVIAAWSPDWHRGVVGIAAGRLAREFHRPSILLSVEGETATGSGRSIRNVHLHDFLARWRPRMERFGGHSQAIGLTARMDALEELRNEWQEAGEEWGPEVLERRRRYDLSLTPEEVGEELLEELEALEPFGQENPQPLLRIGPLSLAAPPRLFGRGHLSAPARGDGGGQVRLLGWSWQDRKEDLSGRFEVLAYLERDTYRGGTCLRLVDCRPA